MHIYICIYMQLYMQLYMQIYIYIYILIYMQFSKITFLVLQNTESNTLPSKLLIRIQKIFDKM